MSEVPDIIAQLVARFDENADHYRGSTYNETLTRIDFINPLFKALAGTWETKPATPPRSTGWSTSSKG